MNWTWMSRALLAAALLAVPVWAQDGEQEGAPEGPDTSDIKVQAYALGVSIGDSVKCAPEEFPVEDMVRGLKAAMNREDLEISAQAVQEAMQRFNMDARGWMQLCAQEEGAENIKKSEAWLEENKTKEGWKVTDSGLQYKVIEQGSGESPAPVDQVKVHYRGTLIDGTQFDSSYDRGQPITFGLNQVIPGWTEGLQLMTEGSKYMLAIPPDLGYGMRRQGSIPPNSALIFEVELIEVIENE